jgi:predicted Rossmann fold nucleotide-binding protein DprA/Smf involved in DNA uptake
MTIIEFLQIILSVLSLIGIGTMIGIYKNQLDKLGDTIKRIFDKIEKIEINHKELHERLLKIEIENQLKNKGGRRKNV